MKQQATSGYHSHCGNAWLIMAAAWALTQALNRGKVLLQSAHSGRNPVSAIFCGVTRAAWEGEVGSERVLPAFREVAESSRP